MSSLEVLDKQRITELVDQAFERNERNEEFYFELEKKTSRSTRLDKIQS